MLGWFKRRPDDDHEWVVRRFRERRSTVERASEVHRLAFQLTLAVFWKAFIAQHRSPVHFAQLPKTAQMDYFKKSLALQSSLFDENDIEKAVPLEMLNLHLAK